MKFEPHYRITPKIAKALMSIEGAKQRVEQLPLHASMLMALRRTARLASTHYSTKIEGNRLSLEQVMQVVFEEKKIPGRVRDGQEVIGYYRALAHVEKHSVAGKSITEDFIKQLHAIVMSGASKKKIVSTPYRDGQNVIYDGPSRHIVYMPPEAKDVPRLMRAFFAWLRVHEGVLPCPLVAAIAHYQYVTIHPYYDGNGRTARLLATLIVHRCGYGLKGIYSLEEYYVRNLGAYYEALEIGPSHNYYLGRAEADITPWLEYFVTGMARACENVSKRVAAEARVHPGAHEHDALLRQLDPRQRHALELFRGEAVITARQIGELFGVRPRTAAQICKDWVEAGFLVIADPSNRKRSYQLDKKFEALVV